MFILILVMLGAYLVGSIPMGYLMVKVFTGKDVREVGSGRTGGTNVMRAAGLAAGIFTAAFDLFKTAASIWIAQAVLPEAWRPIGMVAAGLCSILGHNYSIFLKFKGGAGGAPCVGGGLALWPWSAAIAVPVGVLILFGVGYASIATLSVSVILTLLFAYRAYVIHAPGAQPEFILYGVGSMLLLAWALRSNFRRLLRGEERLVGWRAKRLKQATTAQQSD
jgi:acyl phosphate:glycerol-3-phosphate acyltransferase